MPKIHVNDMGLYYEIHGPDDAPPLLMINGVGQWRAAWFRNLPALQAHFRVIIFDNRGIGESDKPDIEYTLDMFADDTLGLLDHLGIEQTHVLGHSMGGGIAVMMYRKRPAIFSKMILASTLYWGTKVAMPSERAMQVLLDRSGDPVELVERGTRIATAEGFEARDPEGFQRLVSLRFESQQPPHIYLRQSNSGLTYLQGDYIADIQPDIPVLLLVGAADEVAPRGNSDAIAAAWPTATVQEIPGAGHLFNVEQPEATNQAIIEFLKDS
ncbi:MAG: alpha/beta fold hydrolase [Anaerolineales bacterium]